MMSRVFVLRSRNWTPLLGHNKNIFILSSKSYLSVNGSISSSSAGDEQEPQKEETNPQDTLSCKQQQLQLGG